MIKRIRGIVLRITLTEVNEMAIKKENAWQAAALGIAVVIFVLVALCITKLPITLFGLLGLFSLSYFEEE